jgi:hypothetical protein
MLRTSSSKRSTRLPMSLPDEGTSFLEPELAGGMVDEPVPSDTRFSRVQEMIEGDNDSRTEIVFGRN